MRRSFVYALFIALSLVTSLAACNTMAGAGQDMQSGGHALTNSAEKKGAQQ
jgi:entericidin B